MPHIFANMKQFILSLIIVPGLIYGQAAETDTITVHELDEVAVTANNRRTEPTKTVYIPGNMQRAAASDGISLLARMSIPQLEVNPLSGTVKTVDNQGVSLFINSHAASKEEVAGLDPANVLRVEYFDFPTDPRFLRAQHVVNFITKDIQFGGYTKLSAKERLYVNSGEASLYSKFSYKAMEYDVMAVGEYDNNSHTGNQSTESYKFTDGTVKRISKALGGKRRERNIFAGIRAAWNKSERFSFRNLLSIRSDHTPINTVYGTVEIPQLFPIEEYRSSSDLSSLCIDWNSEIYAILGRGWTLNGNILAEYTNNRTVSAYATSETDILNKAHERGWFIRENIQLNKSLTNKSGLFANFISGGGQTSIDYTGNDEAHNKFQPFFGGVSAGLSLSFDKISGNIDGGFAIESSTINHTTVTDSYPFTHLNIHYVPTQTNSFSFWFQYAAFAADAAMKNPNMIQQNELLYISGNPDLHSSKHISTNFSYTFLPNSKWQLSAYAVLFRIINRQAPLYLPDGPDGLMLKRYYNNGDYNHGQIGAKLAVRLMNGKLAVAIAPRLLLYHTTGANRISRYPFCASANVDYYVGPFFFNFFWNSASNYVDGETCYLRRLPNEYSIAAGWSGNGWNIQLSVANLFRSSWMLSDDSLMTKWYDSKIAGFGSIYHRRISVSVAYTINYGRKVNTGNELRNDGKGNSSILR